MSPQEQQTVRALSALAQVQRLRAFRALVVAGPDGLTPSALCEQLGVDAADVVAFGDEYNDHEMLKLAFFNGAKGYLVKDNTSEELVDCISYVLDGKTYIAKSIREQQQLYDGQDQDDLHIAEMLGSLTRTELKTLKLVAQKLSSKEIADLLFVSVKSVENYRSRICKKLNLDARNNSLLMWIVDNKKIIDGIQ